MDTVTDFSESCARRMLRLERDTLLFCTAMVVTSVLPVPNRYQSVVAYLAVLTARLVELLTIHVQLLSKLFEDVNALDVSLSC